MSELIEVLREAGVDLNAVTLLSDGASASTAPPNKWLVREISPGRWWVGGADRGRLVPYDVYEGRSLLTNALLHLTFATIETTSLGAEELAEAERRTTRLDRAVRGAGPNDQMGPIPGGVLVDRFGPEQGHTLFLYRTPFPDRSSPPSDLVQPYHSYVTLRTLPPTVTYGAVAPWFEQPGGGVMVALDRSLRWYYDAGFLDEVVLP